MDVGSVGTVALPIAVHCVRVPPTLCVGVPAFLPSQLQAAFPGGSNKPHPPAHPLAGPHRGAPTHSS